MQYRLTIRAMVVKVVEMLLSNLPVCVDSVLAETGHESHILEKADNSAQEAHTCSLTALLCLDILTSTVQC